MYCSPAPEALNSTFARPPMTRSKRREESSDHRRDFIARVFFFFLLFAALSQVVRIAPNLKQGIIAGGIFGIFLSFPGPFQGRAIESGLAWILSFPPFLLFLPGYRSYHARRFLPGAK